MLCYFGSVLSDPGKSTPPESWSLEIKVYGIPVFDEIEGKVTHAYRFRYPVAGTANVPLSLFDFSESDTVEVSVNAIFYDGEEVLPISLNPCTFQLKKQTHGYAFIGTDSSIHGYRVEELMPL